MWAFGTVGVRFIGQIPFLKHIPLRLVELPSTPFVTGVRNKTSDRPVALQRILFLPRKLRRADSVLRASPALSRLKQRRGEGIDTRRNFTIYHQLACGSNLPKGGVVLSPGVLRPPLANSDEQRIVERAQSTVSKTERDQWGGPSNYAQKRFLVP